MLGQWGALSAWGGINHLLTPWCQVRLLKPGLSRPLACTRDGGDYLHADDHVAAIGAMVREPVDVTTVVLQTQLALGLRQNGGGPLFDAAVAFSHKALRDR
jgi:hypothetical protein